MENKSTNRVLSDDANNEQLCVAAVSRSPVSDETKSSDCVKPGLLAVEIEAGIEFSEGAKIFFTGEKAPMIVLAVSDQFLIASRPLHRWYDANLVKHEVEMGGYFTFTEAFKAMKKWPVYTIVDLKNNIRGPHNLIIADYDFKNKKSIRQLLKDLESGKVEISHRNRCFYNLDFERSINQ